MGAADGVVRLGSRFLGGLEPLHSLIYFAPETEKALVGVGLRPGRMCYFAGRSAAFGAVGPGAVAATFYNFNPELVARHLPRAWTLASPESVVAARYQAADQVLRRLLGDEVVASAEVAEAAELAREASAGCQVYGRALYAAHADLPWPEEPHLVLWHAITLLREHRGDGHIAALVLNGLDGLAALVTHTATGKGFLAAAAKLTRGWSDEQWDGVVDELRASGVMDDGDGLTEKGRLLRRRVEEETDTSSTAPWKHLGPEGAARLFELGRGLTERVVGAGAFPPGVFATR
ncbi:SCO6745 family protein [Amycolatopsis sp. H20-H5]|uniref:SCO6745 family protein n=1 Tax=Amycolatopsis sp. H20-H5 TaxID=3046309 RepID=UPI002DB87A02|nr:hypothetical protein [Amycolatopsis sp. H20-H5]MEC3981922.1 hypothetical protein [Amycolatopsis sp. H20-H5]